MMFDIEKARQAEELAAQCLSDLCHARRRWEMHIPLQSDDPDVLLGDALGQLRSALKEVEQQRQRAETAETRVNELEADLRSVPVMELMRAYPAVRWYVFNDEIRIRKWIEGIETLYAQWLSEQPARQTARV
jgi:hypothetical protein